MVLHPERALLPLWEVGAEQAGHPFVPRGVPVLAASEGCWLKPGERAEGCGRELRPPFGVTLVSRGHGMSPNGIDTAVAPAMLLGGFLLLTA